MDEKLDRFYEIVKTRRSVRKFDTRPVPIDALRRVVEAALWAPSALNMQPWFFYVLTGTRRDEFAVICRSIWDKLKPAIIERYGEEGVAKREPFYRNLGDAPVAIAIYADKDIAEQPAISSCSMAAENLMLAATAEGIGSLYMGAQLLIREQVDEFFGEDRRLIGCVLLGYSADEPKAWERRANRIDWGE
jgi:hypothetical protein